MTPEESDSRAWVAFFPPRAGKMRGLHGKWEKGENKHACILANPVAEADCPARRANPLLNAAGFVTLIHRNRGKSAQ